MRAFPLIQLPVTKWQGSEILKVYKKYRWITYIKQMRSKHQRDDKKSEFMGTYPRSHFCQPSTTPNTPLGKSMSVSWSHWELSSQKFEVFLLQQGRRRFSVPHLVGLHLPKKKEIRLLLRPCEITRRETDGWLVNIRFVLLVPLSYGQQKVQYALP